jgi:hypothetical protein
MKRVFGIAILLVAVAAPALAQWQQWRLSGEDQRRFDSYFARWQDSKQRNDRDDIAGMERRMLDMYERYHIPAETPFWRVASNGRSDREQWRGRLSSADQTRFDSYFSRWQDYERSNNRDQMASMERRMQDIYAHYGIPAAVPYAAVASNSRNEDPERNWDRWRGRLSAGDQARFDSYYTRWLNYKRTNNGSEVASMEKRMFELMQQYGIPQQVPFEQVASR